MTQATVSTPIGALHVKVEAGCLTALRFAGADTATNTSGDPLLAEACRQLTAWFDGKLEQFDLPLAHSNSVRGDALRAAIEAVEYGSTATYGDIARTTGSSARAIGQACARNPLPLIVPCHRVVGANGKIGHYSAGEGVATKRWLLAFESRRSVWAK